MEKKVEVGDIIKLKEEHHDAIDGMIKESESLEMAMEMLAGKIQAHHERFWEAIGEMYPETKDLNCSFNHKNHTLTTIGKRKK